MQKIIKLQVLAEVDRIRNSVLSLPLEDEPDPEAGVGSGRGRRLALVRAEVLERDLLAQEAGRLGVELDWAVPGLPDVLDQVVGKPIWMTKVKNRNSFLRSCFLLLRGLRPMNS